MGKTWMGQEQSIGGGYCRFDLSALHPLYVCWFTEGETFASWRSQLCQPQAPTEITSEGKFLLGYLPEALEHMP